MTSSGDPVTEDESLETKVHRYSREHPHFVRNYLVSITLSLAAGVLLFYFIGGSQLDEQDRLSRVSGAVTLSQSQLIQAVKSSGAVAYWLGPISGSKYTLVMSKPGEAIITYLPNGQGIEKEGERRLIVQTDVNSKSVGPLVSAETEVSNLKETVTGGSYYSYDRYTRDSVVITLANEGGQVRVFYPTTRTANNILLDAESLILIS